MKVQQEMDISVKITRKRGITLVPTFMLLLIGTLQYICHRKYFFVKKLLKILF